MGSGGPFAPVNQGRQPRFRRSSLRVLGAEPIVLLLAPVSSRDKGEPQGGPPCTYLVLSESVIVTGIGSNG